MTLARTASLLSLWLALACSDEAVPSTVPDFAAAQFSDSLQIDNELFPLVPGVTTIFAGTSSDGVETIVVEVTDETRVVMGVEARVVRDRVFLDGLLIEDTRDWYAQDDEGNVWYLGEETVEYELDDEGNVVGMSAEGSWEAGLDVAGTGEVALPGYAMLAAPSVGRAYHQEWYRDEAEDAAEVLSVTSEATLEHGARFEGLLETRDYSTLDPDLDERKLYARGIGVVLIRNADGSTEELLGVFDTAQPAPAFDAARFGQSTTIDNPLMPLASGTTRSYRATTDEGVERIEIEVESETRMVAGVECVVVRDRVYVDERLVEDTQDWFAQDDEGNVWYMGEAVDDYEYDAAGELIEITHPGSWEAGLDVAGVGVPAEPGVVMWAAPEPMRSYRQELYPGEAEDMAYVTRTGVRAEVGGVTYEGCVETLDWVPLDPAAIELKLYAPGVGLVRSYHVDAPEEVVEPAEDG